MGAGRAAPVALMCGRRPRSGAPPVRERDALTAVLPMLACYAAEGLEPPSGLPPIRPERIRHAIEDVHGHLRGIGLLVHPPTMPPRPSERSSLHQPGDGRCNEHDQAHHKKRPRKHQAPLEAVVESVLWIRVECERESDASNRQNGSYPDAERSVHDDERSKAGDDDEQDSC